MCVFQKNELIMADRFMSHSQRQIRLGKTGLANKITHYRKRKGKIQNGR